MKHTETPWHTTDDGDVAANIDGIESLLAETLTHNSIGRHNHKENAEFIVQACNAHDDLVAALENAVEYLDWIITPDNTAGKKAAELRNALAKAKQ